MRKLIIFVLLVGFTIIGLINHDKLDAESNIISNIYCSSCGVESKEKTKFCSNCGEEAIWLTERLELLDETQLSETEFVELKSKQVDWLCYRENTANNDSDNFKGMMFAKVQYNKSLAKLTKERCYELINTYL